MAGRVKEIMTDHVLTIKLDTPFTVACRMFQNFHLRHLPVVDEAGVVIGMFSLYDAMVTLNNRILSHKDLDEEKINQLITISEVMTARDLVVLEESSSISKALELFKKNDLHSILVYSEGKLSGIVTPNDILRSSYVKVSKDQHSTI